MKRVIDLSDTDALFILLVLEGFDTREEYVTLASKILYNKSFKKEN